MKRTIYTQQEMASYIDHTLLKPDATRDDVLRICREAKQYHFASVCVNPAWISLVSQKLKDTDIKPCCVISFPLGSEACEMKVMEAAYVIGQGAKEVDMVINIGAVKSADWSVIEKEIHSVTAVKSDAVVKIIIETCLLTEEEKIRVCEIAKAAGAGFVKTSTGFSTGGATAKDVSLMCETVGADMGVKASGGIRTLEDATIMLAAGASRLGTSAGIEIIRSIPVGGDIYGTES